MPLVGKTPVLTARTFVAPRFCVQSVSLSALIHTALSASVIGEVSIGENSSVWYNAVVSGAATRFDVKCDTIIFRVFIAFSGKVSVGSNSNILESSIVTAPGSSAVSIGSNVVIEQVACCLYLRLL
jgi:carbonic anhydrase/acetyltransferase-like protein (isoleucine patch superfamily)